MLQVVKRSAVRNRGDHRSQLQGGHRDAFAKGAHLAHAAELGGNLLVGVYAQVLALNVVAGQLAQSKLVRVVADFFKAQLAADRFKIGVVGMRQRLSQIHFRPAAQLDFRIFGDQVLAECSQRHGNLDRRAGLRSAGQGQPLIHHGQNASAGRLNGNHGAIHVAKGFNCCSSNHRVFTAGTVAFRDVAGKRTHGEALVIAAVMAAAPVARARRTAARQSTHALASVLIFTDGLRFRF